jgi:hypothetical protein
MLHFMLRDPAKSMALSQNRLSQGKASGQSHECFFQKPLAKEKTLWGHNIIFTNTLQKLAECFFRAIASNFH